MADRSPRTVAPETTPSPLDWIPAALRRAASARSLDAGATLFRQGDRVAAIFGLEAGRVRMVRHTIDDHRVTLHTARAGELFAEAALFSDVYHCDAVADVPSRVRILPKATLLAAFADDPELARRFMAILARQVMTLRTRLEHRNIRPARERILQHLALAAGDGRTVRLDGTLLDLAAEIGLTHEVLYRNLASLERDGVIERDKDAITLVGRREPV
ncbi:MAG TPA: Crp/Fnr family transcriptional regulator [Candidatus Sulfotelmatobacter sp.]|nr:Crp/Fnr family transcriptional regulator [Candidatus Sulfotelmatobacter sp.]